MKKNLILAYIIYIYISFLGVWSFWSSEMSDNKINENENEKEKVKKSLEEYEGTKISSDQTAMETWVTVRIC